MESDHGLDLSVEHDLFGKPASTFPDHALAEARDDLVGYRTRADLLGIVLVAHGPDSRFAAEHRKFAAARDTVLDVEARATEFGDPRGDFDLVAEANGLAAVEPYIDQRQNPENVEEVSPGDAERRLEQRPGAVIEIFEQVLGGHHAGRIAMTEFDNHLPAKHERRQKAFPTIMDCGCAQPSATLGDMVLG